MQNFAHFIATRYPRAVDCIEVRGGKALNGVLHVSGAKNAALPMLCATLLASGEHRLGRVPALRDVHSTLRLLRHLGCEASLSEDGQATLKVSDNLEREAPYALVRQMRASVLVLGPLVARLGTARVSLPGGCAIGSRPIDQHLKGLEAMGAQVALHKGYVECEVPGGRLRGADIHFDMVTVTGTENLLCAAALADGTTRLHNAAREPEVIALAEMLNSMGARIRGAGSSTLEIEGVEALQPAKSTVPYDRIEAGTYMAAAALTRGDVCIHGVVSAHLATVIQLMREAGVEIDELGEDTVRVRRSGPLKPVAVETAPFPGFPTDMQAQWLVMMSQAEGQTMVRERIFENRFMHVPELARMGAQLRVSGDTVHVTAPAQLEGAPVMATDLRASASLVLAGLVAEGLTTVRRTYHLDRGYEDLVGKLSALGANIKRRRDSQAP